MIGFIIVLLAGTSLAAASVILGLQDPICRAQSLQMVYLTIVLAICSILTLFFNSAVLRIAKKQLNAIYAQEPSFKGRRRVSVVCSNCGYKNETFVNTLLPLPVQCQVPANGVGGECNGVGLEHHSDAMVAMSMSCAQSGTTNATATTILPLTDAVVLGPLDLDLNMSCDPEDQNHRLIDDSSAPLVKTVSLPALSETINVPISLVMQPDPSLPPTVVIGNVAADVDLGGRGTSMSNLEEGSNNDPIVKNCGVGQYQTMPRSKSLVNCQTNKIMSPSSALPRLQLFRNLHFARAHMFQVG